MQKNYIFFILSAVLLTKQTLSETKVTPSGKAFRDEVIAKFAVLTEEPLKLEDTYADKPSNPKVTRLYAALRDLERIECAENLSKISVFLRVSLIYKLTSGSIVDDTEDKEKILALKKAFENHNAKSVVNEFQQKFDEFLEWLTLEFEAKSDKLNSEEKLSTTTFIELCRSFKNETNLAKKEIITKALLHKC